MSSLIMQRFFWPGIDSFVAESVKQCPRCICAELINIESTAQMEIVCVDLFAPGKDRRVTLKIY